MPNKAIRLTLACALLIGASSFGFAEDADLEARVEALERRLGSLEKELDSKDAEIARLRERLRRLPGGEEGEAEEGDEGAAAEEAEPGAPFGDALDRMREQLRKRGFDWDFDWDFDWGLPGRRLDPVPRPRSLPLPRGSGAFLGVELEDLAGGGVRIAKVVPDTAAEEVGLREGDAVAEIDGRGVSTSREVIEAVGSKEPGDRISIAVLRDGERLDLTAKLGERPGAHWRVLPRRRGTPGWPPAGGRSAAPHRSETEAAAGTNKIEVEVEIAGGEARVSLDAPGLFMTDELAEDLGLDAAARRRAEEIFAEARNDLAATISEMLREGGASVSADALVQKRQDAEFAAREALAGVLTDGQLEKLERAQAELSSRSQVSISTMSSSSSSSESRDRSSEREKRQPRRHGGASARSERPARPGEGTDF